MALTEEQQEALAARAQALVGRVVDLAGRHHDLMRDSASLQLRPPVSRHAGGTAPVRSTAWRSKPYLKPFNPTSKLLVVKLSCMRASEQVLFSKLKNIRSKSLCTSPGTLKSPKVHVSRTPESATLLAPALMLKHSHVPDPEPVLPSPDWNLSGGLGSCCVRCASGHGCCPSVSPAQLVAELRYNASEDHKVGMLTTEAG